VARTSLCAELPIGRRVWRSGWSTTLRSMPYAEFARRPGCSTCCSLFKGELARQAGRAGPAPGRRAQQSMVRVADANGAEAPLLQGGGKPGVLPDDDHPFWVGPALSVYQNAGGPNTNWAEYETHRNHLGQPVIEARPRCFLAAGAPGVASLVLRCLYHACCRKQPPGPAGHRGAPAT